MRYSLEISGGGISAIRIVQIGGAGRVMVVSAAPGATKHGYWTTPTKKDNWKVCPMEDGPFATEEEAQACADRWKQHGAKGK